MSTFIFRVEYYPFCYTIAMKTKPLRESVRAALMY